MKLFSEKKECCGCGACVDVCKAGAIRMVQDKEGFWYPRVNQLKCKKCGQCKQVCPVRNRSVEKDSRLYLGIQAKEDGVRHSSSSGGIFSLLAQYVFDRQGVVYGAAYNDRMEVMHKEAGNKQQLEQLKRTKYVQSNLNGVYSRIEELLKRDQWVLFCGTPCQAYGLKLFLKKAYEKLIIVDLICYGVPSPGIWSSYVKYLESRHGGRMTDFSFRDKRNKDNGHTCSYVIDGKEYAESLHRNLYCKMYFTNYILRPSCHECKFCTVERAGDFTIGDFWGIEKVRPEMDDGMGTSVVIAHTDKAKKVWEEVKKGADWFECREEEVLQPRLNSPTGVAKRRRDFMRLYRLLPFERFLDKVFDDKGLKGEWR